MADVREEGPFCPPHPSAAPIMPILNRVKISDKLNSPEAFPKIYWSIINRTKQ